MEPNPGEKEVTAGWQDNPNEEIAVHSLRTCRNERMACQEAMKASPEKMEPIYHTLTILERMETTDLKANP
jgi:hypothetical protein